MIICLKFQVLYRLHTALLWKVMVSLCFIKEVTEKPDEQTCAETHSAAGEQCGTEPSSFYSKTWFLFPSTPLSLILIAFENYVCEKEASMKYWTCHTHMQRFWLIYTYLEHLVTLNNLTCSKYKKCHLAVTSKFLLLSNLRIYWTHFSWNKKHQTYLGIIQKWNFDKAYFSHIYLITIKLYLSILEDDLRM